MANYEELLGASFNCDCGREHCVPVRKIVYAEDALETVGEVLGGVVEGHRVVVIADERTWVIGGERVMTSLETAGWSVERIVVGDSDRGGPVCDDVTFEWLKSELGDVDIAVAVGCGVINDLTKWAAFEGGIPYAVVATAATMNGFTAANIAPKVKGVKTLIVGRAPVAVFAVPSVICGAPLELTCAGLGDVLAKSVSTADWVMNHVFCGEYFCEFCSGIINEIEPLYFDRSAQIKAGDAEAIGAVFKALLYSGIGMTLVGTSAPASGGEHLLSHTLDMMSGVDGEEHDLHGRQVGVGTVFAAALYERILRIDEPEFHRMPEEIDRGFWGGVAESVAEQYEQKKPLLERIGSGIRNRVMWDSFVKGCRDHMRPAGEIKGCLQSAGAAHTFGEIKCSRQRIRDAILHMHEIRKRPTVVDLAWMVGVLPERIDELIDEWLTE